ncbi:unnamed protein product [Spodoptera exigua]|nr:unnamed protein product [Spodoptera exigua]
MVKVTVPIPCLLVYTCQLEDIPIGSTNIIIAMEKRMWSGQDYSACFNLQLKSFVYDLFMNLTPPAQRVQFILGEDVDDSTLESHPLFSEMEELVKDGDELEWKETARWIKFEEDVEEGGNRWKVALDAPVRGVVGGPPRLLTPLFFKRQTPEVLIWQFQLKKAVQQAATLTKENSVVS